VKTYSGGTAGTAVLQLLAPSLLGLVCALEAELHLATLTPDCFPAKGASRTKCCAERTIDSCLYLHFEWTDRVRHFEEFRHFIRRGLLHTYNARWRYNFFGSSMYLYNIFTSDRSPSCVQKYRTFFPPRCAAPPGSLSTLFFLCPPCRLTSSSRPNPLLVFYSLSKPCFCNCKHYHGVELKVS